MTESEKDKATAAHREVPVDWESLEDAFENNAPEVHSYLHLTTGEVLRVVDGVADPQMHVRIASDGNYLRIDPVSSREQYRWMERFIPMVESTELRDKLGQAIDGKGAFRRFKDVLMAYGAEREKWFTFRRDLDAVVAFAEFLKARRAARGFAHHHEHQREEREHGAISQRGAKLAETTAAAKEGGDA